MHEMSLGFQGLLELWKTNFKTFSSNENSYTARTCEVRTDYLHYLPRLNISFQLPLNYEWKNNYLR